MNRLVKIKHWLSDLCSGATDPSCDVSDIPDVYESWFYLNGTPDVIPAEGNKYRVFVTMRGTKGLRYEDPVYWTRVRITKHGQRRFTLDEAYQLVDRINLSYKQAHACHA